MKKIPIHVGDPKRGDVIVLKPHIDKTREYYIKRVIGLPGETVRIFDGKVFIKKVDTEDFVEINEPYLSLVNSGQTLVNDQRTEKIFEMAEEELSSIRNIVFMGNEIMKSAKIIENYDEESYIENPDLPAKLIGSVLRSMESVKNLYLKYNPEDAEFLEEFENIFDI